MTIRFDSAWSASLEIAREVADRGFEVVLVRDMLGRICLFLDGPDELPLDETTQRIRETAGLFTAPSPVIAASDLIDQDSIMRSPDLVRISGEAGNGGLSVLERSVIGGDWRRPGIDPPSRRVSLYGFKGGVGRSTAVFMLAQHLAEQGKTVLVVDLDLESPGVGSLAQREENLAEHGIVDHLIEAGVGNADGLDLVSRSQVITASRYGEVWLASTGGRPRDGYDYLAKLNRVYTDLAPDDDGNPRDFGSRLEAAIAACEAQVEATGGRSPDVVLLDSRAGLHDIAAVALTRLSSLNLLFAADTPQTWSGYRMLLSQWRSLDNRADLTRRLRMVSSMTPSRDPESYLAGFADHAQSCFAETLYEDADAGDLESLNFPVGDETAPHYPWPILFHTDLVGLDPAQRPEWYGEDYVKTAFGDFLSLATDWIFGTDNA
ncbi:tyrosine-protein kinase family protein [Amycolatopsis solani]|uniref:tyrosine-protein kinase family protein n=1 Tax=Amycolatopsis solani TaxID=3028615 RepID=UPI0025B206A8|nr:AAA family ATPase [Amycolatopsis sp. MEP2-6]